MTNADKLYEVNSVAGTILITERPLQLKFPQNSSQCFYTEKGKSARKATWNQRFVTKFEMHVASFGQVQRLAEKNIWGSAMAINKRKVYKTRLDVNVWNSSDKFWDLVSESPIEKNVWGTGRPFEVDLTQGSRKSE